MEIAVNSQIRLSELRESDKPAMVESLNDRDIYDQTLRIPFPYTEASADAWFAVLAKIAADHGRQTHFAIRNADDTLIGACGVHDFETGKSHHAEIGYWLAKPYWGRGIMTAVVPRVCQYAFDEFGLVKLTAHVFTGNPASARVLGKCGFVQEGTLRKHYLKDGKFIDAWLFALLK